MCIEKSIFCVTEQPDTISLRVRIMVFKIAYVLYETIYYFKEKFPKTLIWNPNFRSKLENVLICVGIFSIRIYSWLHKIIIVSSVSTMFLHEICLCQFFSVASVFYFSIFEYVGHICTGYSCWMFFIVPTYDYVCVRNMYCTTYALHNHSADYDLEKQSCHSSIAHVQ